MRKPMKKVVGALVGVALAAAIGGCSAQAPEEGASEDVLTIGMSAGDIPNLDTVLSIDQGYEGWRFVGFQLYDGLTRYDLSDPNVPPQVVPALATSYTPNEDGSEWAFELREGVTFSDGTPFDADSVIFNLDRLVNEESEFYYPALAATAFVSASVESYEKTGDHSLTISLNGPRSFFPGDLATFFIASPTAVQELGNEGYAAAPSGTGPFTFVSVERGQELVLAANPDYWDGAPELDGLILKPIPETSARVAALRSGEVDWIEAVTPDDIEPLEASGFTITMNTYDHMWPWIFNTESGPLADPTVRLALQYAIDRESLVTDLLLGTAVPSEQLLASANVMFDPVNNRFGYDPDEAQRLLAEVGYPDGFSMSVVFPTSGSGNMQPTAMNQQLQSDLAQIGVDVELIPLEWAALLAAFGPSGIPDGANAINLSLSFFNESSIQNYFQSASPLNIGKYVNPEVDELLTAAMSETDTEARKAIYTEAVALIDEDSAWLNIVNDLNPRAMTSAVQGFVQPQSWFVDLRSVTMAD